MKRRLNEEGSVYFDPTRNRYRVTARLTDDEGTSKRRSFYGPTAAQALEKMRVAKKACQTGQTCLRCPPDARCVARRVVNWSARTLHPQGNNQRRIPLYGQTHPG